MFFILFISFCSNFEHHLWMVIVVFYTHIYAQNLRLCFFLLTLWIDAISKYFTSVTNCLFSRLCLSVRTSYRNTKFCSTNTKETVNECKILKTYFLLNVFIASLIFFSSLVFDKQQNNSQKYGDRSQKICRLNIHHYEQTWTLLIVCVCVCVCSVAQNKLKYHKTDQFTLKSYQINSVQTSSAAHRR